MRDPFELINRLVRSIESAVVGFVSAIIPWTAGIVPASVTYWHVTGTLGFPVWMGIVAALMVEGLGLTAISTGMDFWAHNRKYKKEYRQAPIWVPISAFLFYLLTIVVVNVLLEVRPDARVLSIAMLTLLQLPAASLLAVRRLHVSLLEEIEAVKRERRENRLEKRRIVEEHRQEPRREVSSAVRVYLERNGVPLETVGQRGAVKPSDIATAIGADPGSVRVALLRMRERNNGHG